MGPDPSCAQESVLESLGLGKCQVLGMFCCFRVGAGSPSALSSYDAFPLQTGVSCSGSAPCRQSANSWRRFAACVASLQQIPPPSSVSASLPWSHRDHSWWCQVCFSQLRQYQQNSYHISHLGTLILGFLWRTWLAWLCVAENRLSQQNSPKCHGEMLRGESSLLREGCCRPLPKCWSVPWGAHGLRQPSSHGLEVVSETLLFLEEAAVGTSRSLWKWESE